MLRAFVSLSLATLIVAPVQGEPIVLSSFGINTLNDRVGPIDIVLDLTQRISMPGKPSTTERLTGLTVHNISPTTMPMYLNIDAANAADFGLDWQAARDWGLALSMGSTSNSPIGWRSFHDDKGSSTTGGGPLSSLPPGIGPQRLINFQLDRIEFDLSYWVLEYYDTAQKFIRTNMIRTDWRFFGDGIIVPEPATWQLAALLAVAVGRRRKR